MLHWEWNLGGGRGQAGGITQETGIGKELCSAVGRLDSFLTAYTKGTNGLSSGTNGLNSTLQALEVITGVFMTEVQTWVAMEIDIAFFSRKTLSREGRRGSLIPFSEVQSQEMQQIDWGHGVRRKKYMWFPSCRQHPKIMLFKYSGFPSA